MTTMIAVSVIASFLITAAIGPFLIRYLRKMNFGQKILSYVPEHAGKQNTPTMGGFMFIISITIVTVAVNLVLDGLSVQSFTVLVLSLCYGVIGFIDDRTKIRKAENEGLTSGQKFALQLVLALVFLTVLHMGGYLMPSLYIPFVGVSLDIPWLIYVVIAAFIMVGCNNAVNLTDGLDGLAAGVTLPVAVYFIVIGAISGNMPVVVFASALAGGLAGFLIFNFNPAKVFMGDTGSLFLGGAVAGLAFACDQPLILALVGLIYVIETLSDIIQVTYYKMTKKPVLDENGNPVRDAKGNIKMEGKRIFRKAPLHHHFQLCGWSEKKIVLVFAGITVLMCILSYFGVAPRYL
ncbi:phospho-N-acetylmuramoyl-pentapeptide-transferase [Butyricicoccus sp.]|uniref:phospho-N-acetylmuramoyl-pentapeptide- transferase n=1 Tax=Butyricicoccus sp. TaxID=2049021 RepID=UPI003F180CDE